jgi:demethylmenaquinone methyltransferase/2-methoxy-6-polyprenyl-1,4-benzoquinol methylase
VKEPVKPYQDADTKKSQVSRMFNNIAPYYDFLNRFLSLGIDQRWRKRAIAELGNQGPRLLDIATGTADVALALAKLYPQAHITGVDISVQMLEVGLEKVTKASLGNQVTLTEADSENLPFESNTFDGITVAFGVRNFENLQLGLREMQRVLRPGGKLVVLEFSRPRSFPFKHLFQFYFRYILPFIGRISSRDSRAYSYLYESVQAFPDGEDFLAVLRESGFGQTKSQTLTLGVSSIYSGIKS